MRSDPARHYVLRNVLVREGQIVLFIPPLAPGAAPHDGPTTLFFFRPGIGPAVNISYVPTAVGGPDPFATCAHSGWGLLSIWSASVPPGWLVRYHLLVHAAPGVAFGHWHTREARSTSADAWC